MPTPVLPVLCLTTLVVAAVSAGDVYQFSVPIPAAPSGDGKAAAANRALLWVPPQAQRIRGLLIGQCTLMEKSFAGDPLIRAACAAESLGIVLVGPQHAFDGKFPYKERPELPALLEKTLADLAQRSGMPEIASAPLMPYGHSVASIYASRVVGWAPQRCFGALLLKGNIDLVYHQSWAGIPALIYNGEFEEFRPDDGKNGGALKGDEDRTTQWRMAHDKVAAFRKASPTHLVSLLIEPGSTHMSWGGGRVAPTVAAFIRGAASLRLTDQGGCKDVPATAGAVSSAFTPGATRVAAKAVRDLSAEDAAWSTFWHPSLEAAQAADALHAAIGSKRPQYIAYTNPLSKKIELPQTDMRIKIREIAWASGDEIRVLPLFLDTPTVRYPADTRPVGHASGEPQMRAFQGTLVQTSPTTFRVAPDGITPIKGDLLAWHPGDAEFRWAEQPLRLTIPDTLTAGTAQTIDFAQPADLKADAGPTVLKATASSGKPVWFYVEEGPARIEGDRLFLADVPLRGDQFRITVVATQYGSAIEPKVQSAPAIKRTFTVRR